MTDDQTTPEDLADSNEPDAFVLVHQPSDGSERYGIGPFPPVPGFEEELVRKKKCDCEVTVLWVAFPAGVRVLVGVDLTEVDPSGALALLAVRERESDDLVN